MKREPLFKIGYRLRKMTLAEQTVYLIACRNCERPDSQRYRELQVQLVDARTRQIRQEMRTKNERT